MEPVFLMTLLAIFAFVLVSYVARNSPEGRTCVGRGAGWNPCCCAMSTLASHGLVFSLLFVLFCFVCVGVFFGGSVFDVA